MIRCSCNGQQFLFIFHFLTQHAHHENKKKKITISPKEKKTFTRMIFFSWIWWNRNSCKEIERVKKKDVKTKIVSRRVCLPNNSPTKPNRPKYIMFVSQLSWNHPIVEFPNYVYIYAVRSTIPSWHLCPQTLPKVSERMAVTREKDEKNIKQWKGVQNRKKYKIIVFLIIPKILHQQNKTKTNP